MTRTVQYHAPSSPRFAMHLTLTFASSLTLLLLLQPIMATHSNNYTSASTPVTRIACFKFLPNVTAEQKGGRTSAFLDLYAQHPELILGPPKGGRPLNTPLDLTNVKREKEWDTGFVVMFKSDEARKEFDLDPTHDKLKNETDPLLEQVFVYDFIEQTNLGW